MFLIKDILSAHLFLSFFIILSPFRQIAGERFTKCKISKQIDLVFRKFFRQFNGTGFVSLKFSDSPTGVIWYLGEISDRLTELIWCFWNFLTGQMKCFGVSEIFWQSNWSDLVSRKNFRQANWTYLVFLKFSDSSIERLWCLGKISDRPIELIYGLYHATECHNGKKEIRMIFLRNH